MRYRKLGKTGPEVSEISFGAWAIGGAMWGRKRDHDARASLERAFERGVTLYGQALVKLRAQGKVRLTGISINSHDPGSALGVVKERMVDVLQVFYNIFDQSPEDALFPACIEHGVGVLARVPFDEGSLTGKLTVDT